MRRKADPNVAGQADKMPDSLPVTSSVPAELPEKQETLAREVLMALERPRYSFRGRRGFRIAGAHRDMPHYQRPRSLSDPGELVLCPQIL
jgi:hypothetical protein